MLKLEKLSVGFGGTGTWSSRMASVDLENGWSVGVGFDACDSYPNAFWMVLVCLKISRTSWEAIVNSLVEGL